MSNDDLLPIGPDEDDFLSAVPGGTEYKVDVIVDSATDDGHAQQVPIASLAAAEIDDPAKRAPAMPDDDGPIPASLNANGLSALADATGRREAAAGRAEPRLALVDSDTLLNAPRAAGPVAEHGSSVLEVRDYRGHSHEHAPDVADTHIDELLRMCQTMGGSDLHVTAGLPPMIRKDGKVIALEFAPLTDTDTQRLVYDILTTEQISKFEMTRELDFSYGVRGLGRYRFNVYRQRGSVGAAMRVIPQAVPSIDELRLPSIVRELTRRHAGLVLVTGPTGSGKSTTIASMLDVVNSERPCHIMTIEDPIEYLHRHKMAMVNQRELGTDTDSFHNALRAVLREDPDVILIGEMRDLETIAAAVTLAETGHLVFATLHTRSAASTVDRVVDVFPTHQQQQIRIQLSGSLEAVVSQQLLPRLGGGRVAAIEIMTATSAIRNLIREGKTHQMLSVIETSQQHGMQAMDRVLADLHRQNMISLEEASSHALDRENFQHLLKGY